MVLFRIFFPPRDRGFFCAGGLVNRGIFLEMGRTTLISQVNSR